MEDPDYNNAAIQQEEEGFDIAGLLKALWKSRKLIIICTAIFIALGLVAALTMQRKYKVTTVMVPQMNSSRSSSLSSLASLAGFDLGMATNGSDLSPLIYPQIVSSVPYRMELLYTPLHYDKIDTAVNMLTYFQDYAKPSVTGLVVKYTIGLPFVILKAIQREPEDIVLPESGDNSENADRPLVLTNDEEEMIRYIGDNVQLSVDKKEGYLTLSVIGQEPIQTAELAIKAQQLLQDEITRFRTEKAQSQVDYLQARYDEVKKEAESYQSALATITDRSQNMPTTRARIERDRIQSKYNVANAIYLELAKQLEQAKMQVKMDTPVFTIVQPVTVPVKSANSRARTLIIWTFLGFVLGCGIVLVKLYWPKVKEMFSSEEKEKESDEEKA